MRTNKKKRNLKNNNIKIKMFKMQLKLVHLKITNSHNFLINLKIFLIKHLIFKKIRTQKKNLNFNQIQIKQLLILEINQIQ